MWKSTPGGKATVAAKYGTVCREVWSVMRQAARRVDAQAFATGAPVEQCGAIDNAMVIATRSNTCSPTGIPARGITATANSPSTCSRGSAVKTRIRHDSGDDDARHEPFGQLEADHGEVIPATASPTAVVGRGLRRTVGRRNADGCRQYGRGPGPVVRSTSLLPDGHPVRLPRAYLDAPEILPASATAGVGHGTRVLVGGATTHVPSFDDAVAEIDKSTIPRQAIQSPLTNFAAIHLID